MVKSEIIKYQLPDEIIKYINKKKDIYNILFVCRVWYNCGIKYLYKDFSYEYTLLKVPTTTQLEWVKHYHTWIDAAEEKRHFQLYTLIKGMKRLESIHIDIFGHIKYFKKYRKFLYKFADLKKNQIKTLHISLDILDDNISDNSLIKFKTIFTQFIKIFKCLDVLILESGEENPFLDIQRLMIECLTNVYDNKSSTNIIYSRPTITIRPPLNIDENNNDTEANVDEINEGEGHEEEEESDDEGTIISDTELSTESENEYENEYENEFEYEYEGSMKHKRHMLKKLIIYDNNSINIEESLSDIISKIPLKELTIRSYLPKNLPEPISSVARSAEPFWRINRYKKELLNKYPEYFSSLSLENHNNNLNIDQFTNYENFCNRSKDRICRKLYNIYYENLKRRKEYDNIISSDYESEEYYILNTSTEKDYTINYSSSLKSNCSSISDLSDSSCTTIVNSYSSVLSNNSTNTLNNITTNDIKHSSMSYTHENNNYMESLCLKNCQSISVKLFSIIVSKLSHLSTIKLNNISFLPEFCVLKLLIGSGKNLRHLELNMASHQLTPDIIVCIATENNNLNTLYLKSSDNPMTIDIETINWMLTLCNQLYSFTIENADETVHNYYKKNYNIHNSSYHQYKKTILNKTVINKIQKNTLINYEKQMSIM